MCVLCVFVSACDLAVERDLVVTCDLVSANDLVLACYPVVINGSFHEA